jgi:mRNA interferase YafQ
MSLLATVIDDLCAGKALAHAQRDHKLKGRYKDYRECHLQFDWVLTG